MKVGIRLVPCVIPITKKGLDVDLILQHFAAPVKVNFGRLNNRGDTPVDFLYTLDFLPNTSFFLCFLTLTRKTEIRLTLINKK